MATGGDLKAKVNKLLKCLVSKSKSSTERAEAYQQLALMLQSGDLDCGNLTNGQRRALLTAIIDDMLCEDHSLAEEALLLLAQCLPSEKFCRTFIVKESKCLVAMFHKCIVKHRMQRIARLCLRCLSVQCFETFDSELIQAFMTIARGSFNVYVKWTLESLAQEVVEVIERLMEQAPEEMDKVCDKWGPIIVPLTVSPVVQARDAAFSISQSHVQSFCRCEDLRKELATFFLENKNLDKLLVDLFKQDQTRAQETVMLLLDVLSVEFHRGSLISLILPACELGFKSQNPERTRIRAFQVWRKLIGCLSSDPAVLSKGRFVNLIMEAFNSSTNAKAEAVALEKFDCWWFFINKLGIYAGSCFEEVITPLLQYVIHGSPSAPFKLLNTVSEIRIPEVKRRQPYRSILLKGPEVLARLLGPPPEGIHIPYIEFSLPALTEKVFSSPKYFTQQGAFLASTLKDLLVKLEQGFPEPLFLYIWHSYIAHLTEAHKTMKDIERHQLVSAFLKHFRSVALKKVFAPETVLELIGHMTKLPQGLLGTRGYDIDAHVLEDWRISELHLRGSLSLRLMEILLSSEIIKLEPKCREYMEVFTCLLNSGPPGAPLHYWEAVILLLVDKYMSVESTQVLHQLWMAVAEAVLNHVVQENNVNQATRLKYDFGCLYGVLSYPFHQRFIEHLNLTTRNKLLNMWTKLYRNFARLSEMVHAADSNASCEELCERFLEQCYKSLNLGEVYVLSYMCHVLMDCFDFSTLGRDEARRLENEELYREECRRDRETPMMKLQSITLLICHMLKAVSALVPQQELRKKQTPAAEDLCAAVHWLVDMLVKLFAHVSISSTIRPILEKVVPPLAEMYQTSAKKSNPALHTISFFRKLENLWQHVAGCLKSRYKGPYDSDLLDVLAPLLAATFVHPRRALQSESLSFWEATFATAKKLAYPRVLRPVLVRVKQSLPITLPCWTHDNVFPIKLDLWSLSQDGDSMDAMDHHLLTHRQRGSLLHRQIPESVLKTGGKLAPAPKPPKRPIPVDDMPAEDFVVIKSTPKKPRNLTEHQKEVLSEKKFVPDMFSLFGTASQDRSILDRFESQDSDSSADDLGIARKNKKKALDASADTEAAEEAAAFASLGSAAPAWSDRDDLAQGAGLPDVQPTSDVTVVEETQNSAMEPPATYPSRRPVTRSSSVDSSESTSSQGRGRSRRGRSDSSVSRVAGESSTSSRSGGAASDGPKTDSKSSSSAKGRRTASNSSSQSVDSARSPPRKASRRKQGLLTKEEVTSEAEGKNTDKVGKMQSKPHSGSARRLSFNDAEGPTSEGESVFTCLKEKNSKATGSPFSQTEETAGDDGSKIINTVKTMPEAKESKNWSIFSTKDKNAKIKTDTTETNLKSKLGDDLCSSLNKLEQATSDAEVHVDDSARTLPAKKCGKGVKSVCEANSESGEAVITSPPKHIESPNVLLSMLGKTGSDFNTQSVDTIKTTPKKRAKRIGTRFRNDGSVQQLFQDKETGLLLCMSPPRKVIKKDDEVAASLSSIGESDSSQGSQSQSLLQDGLNFEDKLRGSQGSGASQSLPSPSANSMRSVDSAAGSQQQQPEPACEALELNPVQAKYQELWSQLHDPPAMMDTQDTASAGVQTAAVAASASGGGLEGDSSLVSEDGRDSDAMSEGFEPLLEPTLLPDFLASASPDATPRSESPVECSADPGEMSSPQQPVTQTFDPSEIGTLAAPSTPPGINKRKRSIPKKYSPKLLRSRAKQRKLSSSKETGSPQMPRKEMGSPPQMSTTQTFDPSEMATLAASRSPPEVNRRKKAIPKRYSPELRRPRDKLTKLLSPMKGSTRKLGKGKSDVLARKSKFPKQGKSSVRDASTEAGKRGLSTQVLGKSSSGDASTGTTKSGKALSKLGEKTTKGASAKKCDTPFQKHSKARSGGEASAKKSRQDPASHFLDRENEIEGVQVEKAVTEEEGTSVSGRKATTEQDALTSASQKNGSKRGASSLTRRSGTRGAQAEETQLGGCSVVLNVLPREQLSRLSQDESTSKVEGEEEEVEIRSEPESDDDVIPSSLEVTRREEPGRGERRASPSCEDEMEITANSTGTNAEEDMDTSAAAGDNGTRQTEEVVVAGTEEMNTAGIGLEIPLPGTGCHTEGTESPEDPPSPSKLEVETLVNSPSSDPVNSDASADPVNDNANDLVNSDATDSVNSPANDPVNNDITDSVNSPANEPVNSDATAPMNIDVSAPKKSGSAGQDVPLNSEPIFDSEDVSGSNYSVQQTRCLSEGEISDGKLNSESQGSLEKGRTGSLVPRKRKLEEAVTSSSSSVKTSEAKVRIEQNNCTPQRLHDWERRLAEKIRQQGSLSPADKEKAIRELPPELPRSKVMVYRGRLNVACRAAVPPSPPRKTPPPPKTVLTPSPVQGILKVPGSGQQSTDGPTPPKVRGKLEVLLTH